MVIDCADYVGNDIVEPPGSVPCGSYFTGIAPAMTNAANTYWCQFYPSYLKIACHSTTPPPGECGSSLAMCLKRGSGTGGCEGIAHTMLCRSLQFDYEAAARDGSGRQHDRPRRGIEPANPYEPSYAKTTASPA